MYVCVCKAVTDKQIKQAHKDGVTDFRGLREKTGIGTQCGKCCGDAKNCLRQAAELQ